MLPGWYFFKLSLTSPTCHGHFHLGIPPALLPMLVKTQNPEPQTVSSIFLIVSQGRIIVSMLPTGKLRLRGGMPLTQHHTASERDSGPGLCDSGSLDSGCSATLREAVWGGENCPVRSREPRSRTLSHTEFHHPKVMGVRSDTPRCLARQALLGVLCEWAARKAPCVSCRCERPLGSVTNVAFLPQWHSPDPQAGLGLCC